MTVYYDSPLFTLHHGDALKVLSELPDESVHMCITSPPYYGLRSYLPDGHPDKKYELGSEPSLDAYLECIVGVLREVRRVLRGDGTCWLNIGDGYTSGGRADYGPSKPDKNIVLHNAARVPQPPGLKPKDLLLVPFRLALALQADGWYVRQVIVWAKGLSFCDSYSGSVMPESARDRPTTAHEYLLLLSKNATYFYDQEACREKSLRAGDLPRGNYPGDAPEGVRGRWDGYHPVPPNRNLRSIWIINPQPYPGPHYATYPEKLVEPCVLLGTSAKGCCPECGASWERETETSYDAQGRTSNGPRSIERRHETAGFKQRLAKSTETLGWHPGCKCLEPFHGYAEEAGLPPCTVLDPFLGSGTTALVAYRLGRRCIGIELSADDCERAVRRVTGSETREIATDADAHADGTLSLLGALTEPQGGMP